MNKETAEVQEFRKKPVVIQALEWKGYNWNKLAAFMGGCPPRHPIHDNPVIHTLEGDHLVSKGDWVIRGVAGEFYPCKPDIFAATYEPASSPSTPTEDVIRQMYEALADMKQIAYMDDWPLASTGRQILYEKVATLLSHPELKRYGGGK